MDAEWLTYREAAARLGSNIEAIRQRAIRCRWPRILGNDKRARVQIPEGLTDPSQEGIDRGSRHSQRGGNERAYERSLEWPLIKALEAHVETLKERLAAADAALVAERAKSAQAIAAFASLADRLDAMAAERTKRWWRRLTG